MWLDTAPVWQPGVQTGLLCGFGQRPRFSPWLGSTEESPGAAPGWGSRIPHRLNLGRPPPKLPLCCSWSSQGPWGSSVLQSLYCSPPKHWIWLPALPLTSVDICPSLPCSTLSTALNTPLGLCPLSPPPPYGTPKPPDLEKCPGLPVSHNDPQNQP